MEKLGAISLYAIPVVILLVILLGLIKRIKVYDIFVLGAKDGLKTVVRIIPTLVGLMVAVGVFKASGALDLLILAVKPFAVLIGIPAETIPLALMRPVSGSASLAIVNEIINTYGPDSYIGRTASVMMGSTETIFYTLTIYFGSVGIKNIRFTLVAALLADFVSVTASALVCALIFGKN